VHALHLHPTNLADAIVNCSGPARIIASH
jgi:hypothetical protein